MTTFEKFGIVLFIVALGVCLAMCASTTALIAAAAALGVRP